MPGPPEWIFLDAGGTLITPRPSVGGVYARAGAAHGLTADVTQLDQAFAHAWETADRDPSPARRWGEEADCRRFWRGIVEPIFDRVSFAGDREACFAACYEAFEQRDAWTVFDDVRPALRDLTTRGIPLGVLSNWDYRLPRLLDQLGLAAAFALVQTSATEEVEKPDPRFFALACRRAGVDPARALHVGDRRDLDVLPARAAGLTALRLARGATAAAADEIRSLGDLVDRLPF